MNSFSLIRSIKLFILLNGMIMASIVLLSSSIFAYESFHAKSSIPKMNYDSLYNIAVKLDSSKVGQAVLDSCLSTYGGVEKLRKLRSIKAEWSMISMMSKDTVTVTKSIAEGRMYSIDKKLPSNRFERRIINGKKAWFQTKDTLIELNNGRYKAELFSCLVLQMPFAAINEHFSEIKYGQREGDSLHYLYFNKADSILIVIGISPDNYYIKSAEGVISQDGQGFVFINKFMDHKLIDGYLFPQAMTNISMWLTVGQSVLKDIKINEPFKEDYFYPHIKRDLNKAY